MKKFIFFIISTAAVFLYSCGSEDKPVESGPTTEMKEGKCNKFYGGVFHMNEPEYIKNLFPHNITDAYSYHVANQVYEGLLKFDQSNLEIEKSLAESYTVDSSGTVYTFKIKKGVHFHDDPCFPGGKGREMKAQDIVYCFTRLCSASDINNGFIIFQDILKGANEYYEASKSGTPEQGVEGIKLIDDYTVQLTLERPSSVFLYELAGPYGYIFPKEAYEKYGKEMRIKAVGTGPFKISNVDEEIKIILTKNKNYHGVDECGNKLPFLDAIEISFIKEKKVEFINFKKRELDMIHRLPTDDIIEILTNSGGGSGEYSEYILQRKPEMAAHYLGFMNQNSIFENKDLRKAFSYAIDKKKILEFVLNGEGDAPGYWGITPNTFKGYDVTKIQGYRMNADSAKFYMTKAGYPNGKDFPNISLQLNSGGERNSLVLQEVKKQLEEVLNIEIELTPLPIALHVENMMSGKSEFFRTGWLTDYPNPEGFLSAFHSESVPDDPKEKSYPNLWRYKNPEFDKLFEAGMKAKTSEDAFEYFLKAEQVLMDDAPVIVLWYDEGYRLLQPYVKNFPSNAMQYRDFSAVYFDFPKEAQETE